MKSTYADKIRAFIVLNYIEPAKKSGQQTITISAKDIHTALNMKNRFTEVCSAINTVKFAKEAKVIQIERSGPRYSSTVTWTFRID